MAAHVLTALNQIIARPEQEFRHIPAALSISCWTEDLELSQYVDLRELAYTTREDRYEMLATWAKAARWSYQKEWESLGKPDTREEWRVAKYGL